MFSGYAGQCRNNADFYVKDQRAATASQEKVNIALVKHKLFAPQTMTCCDDQVYSTRGVPLHEFLEVQPSKLEICLVASAGYQLIALLHRDGFYHLDAKLTNIIVGNGHRPGGVNVTLLSGKVHLFFVDFETLWAPADLQTCNDIEVFNEGSEALAAYGWKPHAHYADLEHAYRYDVHTYSESLRSVCTADDPKFSDLQTAHARVLGHIPDAVFGEDVAGHKRHFTEYLLDPLQPVLSPMDAITVVQATHFPENVRRVKWKTTPCECTETEYCTFCVDDANRALNTLCPFAVPDIVGEHDDYVKATMMRCFLLCGSNSRAFAAALMYLNARPGDCARLLGVLTSAL